MKTSTLNKILTAATDEIKRNAVTYEDKDFQAPRIEPRAGGKFLVFSNDARIKRALEAAGYLVKQGLYIMEIYNYY